MTEVETIQAPSGRQARRTTQGAQPNPLLIDRHEAARLLSVSVSTVKRMMRGGKLSTVPMGRVRRIPLADVLRLAGDGCAVIPQDQ